VTVTAYDVSDRRVLVPQLIEPDRTRAVLLPTRPSTTSVMTRGAEIFAEAIGQLSPEHQPRLSRLLRWATQLESDGLAVLYTSTSQGRWVLNVRLPNQDRSLVTIWTDQSGSLCPFRSVFEQECPKTLHALDERLAGEIRQGNFIKSEYDDDVLSLLRAAYEEASRLSPLASEKPGSASRSINTTSSDGTTSQT